MFYNGQITSARFFIETVLPVTHGKIRSNLKTYPDAAMSMDEAAILTLDFIKISESVCGFSVVLTRKPFGFRASSLSLYKFMSYSALFAVFKSFYLHYY